MLLPNGCSFFCSNILDLLTFGLESPISNFNFGGDGSFSFFGFFTTFLPFFGFFFFSPEPSSSEPAVRSADLSLSSLGYKQKMILFTLKPKSFTEFDDTILKAHKFIFKFTSQTTVGGPKNWYAHL